MKLVIEIPEEYYNAIKAIPDIQCYADMLIIKNGTPLPKGHGRIIDESKIEVCEWVDVWEEVYPKASTDAPTIIEADGGNEDETNN